MSAFLALIADATACGVTKLSWECDTDDWDANPRREDRWTCRATCPEASRSGPAVTTVYAGLGRTGEEALRVVVDFLRRIT